jgi:hypothetical protein
MADGVSMTKRQLSQTPSAIAARDRRLDRAIEKQVREFNSEVQRGMMERGLSFEDAWIAAGGDIIPLVFNEPEADR